MPASQPVECPNCHLSVSHVGILHTCSPQKPVDYIALLQEIVEAYDRLPGWIEDEGARLDENERADFARTASGARSLATHLTTLRNITRGCGCKLTHFPCGAIHRGRLRLCIDCCWRQEQTIAALTHTTQGEAK